MMTRKVINAFDHELMVVSEISDDIMCGICNCILSDAMYSDCGCQYCRKCIQEWIKDGNIHCPGETEECFEVKLQLDKTINLDVRTQKKIERLKVSCPNSGCEYEDDLKRMDQHLSVCDKSISLHNCPFSEIGCNLKQVSIDIVKNHVENGIHMHSILLNRTITSIQNEVKSFNVVNLKKMENHIMQLQDMMLQEAQEMRKQLNEMSVQWIDAQRQINELQTKINHINKPKTEKFRREIFCVDDREDTKSNYYDNCSEVNSMVSDFSTSTSTFFQKEPKPHNWRGHHYGTLSPLTGMSKTVSKMQTRRSEFSQKQMNCEYNEATIPFTWTIDNLNDKRKMSLIGKGETMYSDSFYRNGYNFCLRANINIVGTGRETHLSVYFVIIRGLYDDCLSWPMKNKIHIYLINQATNSECKIHEYCYDKTPDEWKHCYNKPKSDKNPGFGHHQLIRWSDLQRANDIIKDDSIAIGCRVIR